MLYTNPRTGTKCAYCGQTATERDHVLPRSADVPKSHLRRLTVVCCSECNQLAANFIHDSVRERREFVQTRLSIKYRKLLDSPDWTEVELCELGPDLRQNILAHERAKEQIRERLAWSGYPEETRWLPKRWQPHPNGP
jgi:hypothetical protein